MLNKEPTAIINSISELVRQIVPMLILFGVIHWTDQQIAAVFMVLGAFLTLVQTLITRTQVVPTVVANKQIEIAKAADVSTPTSEIIAQAKEII